MKKEKIIGINNNYDSIWFKLDASDKSVEEVDKIFDIYDLLFEKDAKKIYSYKELISFGDVSFLKEDSNFFVYFIFTPKLIHLILRKVGNYESKKNEILDVFEFKK